MARQKMLTSAVLGLLLLVGAACGSATASGSDGSDSEAVNDPTADTLATSGDATSSAGDAESGTTTDGFLDRLRDVRYCEVLLVNSDEEGYSAEVWNTLGLNECPQDQWDALDPEAMATERDALTAVMNGPRYWVLDRIVANASGDAPADGTLDDRRLTTFGELEMFLAASVDLGTAPPSQDRYVERSVARDTVFGFDAGGQVYQLTDPQGTVYVMQAYSQIVDPDLTIDQLAGLGSVIDPPAGWTFSTRVLDEDLDILSTDRVATVIQDELANTYQRIDT